jgi:mannose-6-phosphate isomerase-like protein (cupin superfamily)
LAVANLFVIRVRRIDCPLLEPERAESTSRLTGCRPSGRQPKKENTVKPTEFEDFAAEARAQGFDEVTERHWDPRVALDTHTHPFAVKAKVVRGEMWLTVGDETRHLRPGDTFELERDVPHAERYGVDGATYWAARRHGQ